MKRHIWSIRNWKVIFKNKDNGIVTLIYMGLGYLNQRIETMLLSIDYFKSVAVNIV